MRFPFRFLPPIGLVAASLPLVGNLAWSSIRTTALAPELWREVEIIRTAHGVPHIRAQNLRAAGYALAWVQLEDYGPRTAMSVLRAHGGRGRVFGHDSINSDFAAKRARDRAIATYHRLDQDTRDIYDGFAIGVNRYVELHPEEFPGTMLRNFTGYDVAALDVDLAPTA